MSYLDHPFVPEAMAGRSHDARTYPLFSEVGVAQCPGAGVATAARLGALPVLI